MEKSNAEQRYYIKEAFFKAQDGKWHKIHSVSPKDLQTAAYMDIRLELLRGEENARQKDYLHPHHER